MKSGFLHQSCIYGSDAEFLSMAVPFVQDGLRRNEPVLVTTTSANLDLVQQALGAQASDVDYAESAYFGRRPPQRATAFQRYWTRHRPAAPSGVVRILAEPIWFGRSQREVAAWKRMEAGLNVVLADTTIWMICPYDTRAVDAAIIRDALRTHPECVAGRRAEPCSQFVTPAEFAKRQSPPPRLPRDDAEVVRFDGALAATRLRVLGEAERLLPSEDNAAMFAIAVGEAMAYLHQRGIERVTAWVRLAAGRVVCTVHSAQPLNDLPPFVGFRTPALREQNGDGLWLANQICEWLDISSDDSGCTIELAVPGPRAEEEHDVD
ncbi:MEDS domain-containing protein [Kutzneria buriramensis]|uniref:DcmR-like sensory protein n=1 Tax=Kutzneria buriramensis TaxID=1045776 RepID=A0A3E0H438_9PSEU|nr:MEDS domain-containing protein [Kutzneria buriramensis]REH38018.1 DcmR-like sensory protein [Kutzneria buriramensis]